LFSSLLELPLEAAAEGRSVGQRHPQRSGQLVDVPLLDVEGVPTSVAGGASDAVLRP
jgi:amidophosphoribosyltransferase